MRVARGAATIRATGLDREGSRPAGTGGYERGDAGRPLVEAVGAGGREKGEREPRWKRREVGMVQSKVMLSRSATSLGSYSQRSWVHIAYRGVLPGASRT